MELMEKMLTEGVDMDAGKYVILDKNSHLIIQSDSFEEVKKVLDQRKPGAGGIIYIDLDGIRNDDRVFY